MTQIKLLRCSYGEFTQPQTIGPISWPFFDLFVVHQGQVEIGIKNHKKYKLTGGEALLIYPNTEFSGTVETDTCLASVQHFSLGSLDKSLTAVHLRGFDEKAKGAEYYLLDNSMLTDLERSLGLNNTLLPAANIQQMQSNLLHLVLGQLAYQKHKILPNSRYKAAFTQLLEDFVVKPQQPINIEEMAAKLHLSTSHFRAEFCKLYGQPPQRYLLRVRMQAACQLLAKGQLPIKSISAILGYEDISIFYRHFKKVLNTTPLQYRQQKQVVG